MGWTSIKALCRKFLLFVFQIKLMRPWEACEYWKSVSWRGKLRRRERNGEMKRVH